MTVTTLTPNRIRNTAKREAERVEQIHFAIRSFCDTQHIKIASKLLTKSRLEALGFTKTASKEIHTEAHGIIGKVVCRKFGMRLDDFELSPKFYLTERESLGFDKNELSQLNFLNQEIQKYTSVQKIFENITDDMEMFERLNMEYTEKDLRIIVRRMRKFTCEISDPHEARCKARAFNYAMKRMKKLIKPETYLIPLNKK